MYTKLIQTKVGSGDEIQHQYTYVTSRDSYKHVHVTSISAIYLFTCSVNLPGGLNKILSRQACLTSVTNDLN